ncbi:hypothetical protein [Coralliovum pocilloporae]|uniref:hypothetical protein n=1 Tax=Coralliovum pocilloporae TaxID=3066369 RepID=UPI003306BD7A
MNNQQDESTSIWNINFRFLYSVFIMAVGYGYWLMSSREWFFFYVLAIGCAIAGTAYFLVTLKLLFQRIRMDSKAEAFRTKGTTAKGDKLPGPEDLRKRGLLR